MGAVPIIVLACNLVFFYVYPEANGYICGTGVVAWFVIQYWTYARAIHFQAEDNRKQRLENE